MGKRKDWIFGIVVEKTSESLRLHFLVGRRVKRLSSERFSSEPESSSEFVALVEEDRGYLSAPESDASEASFGSTPPSPEAHSLEDYDVDDGVLGPGGLRPSAGSSFFLHLRWSKSCAF